MYLKTTKTTLPYPTSHTRKLDKRRNASICCRADCMYVKISLSALFSHFFSISSQTDGLPYAVRCSFLSFFHSYFFFLLSVFWGSLGSVFVRSYPFLMMLNFSGRSLMRARIGWDVDACHC
ncbi:uncharacterized protein BO88DRAFT_154228 [Aspergillus vadensis CBS 113365]|uniref:Uncharacterized protein n=1 Tax=Aspergillus vadensis (strain CBS 113365 / IMI 142717 / IBT 24658) TaxID=1448311 RepID=A0A319AX67_ASPVC|nr:hypothetical protein BO88DRAFT_154228 [Aspergillus vadensis CBS 113365]PYH64839.1 hypothetical protein BO88DRAFT_154228 [Aspergillus vadensis CBS 113365]